MHFLTIQKQPLSCLEKRFPATGSLWFVPPPRHPPLRQQRAHHENEVFTVNRVSIPIFEIAISIWHKCPSSTFLDGRLLCTNNAFRCYLCHFESLWRPSRRWGVIMFVQRVQRTLYEVLCSLPFSGIGIL